MVGTVMQLLGLLDSKAFRSCVLWLLSYATSSRPAGRLISLQILGRLLTDGPVLTPQQEQVGPTGPIYQCFLSSLSMLPLPPAATTTAVFGSHLSPIHLIREVSSRTVANLGCLSRIRIFPIPDPGSKRFRIPNPEPH